MALLGLVALGWVNVPGRGDESIPGLSSLGQLVVPQRSMMLESAVRHGPSQGSGCQHCGTVVLQLTLKQSCCSSHAESWGQKSAHGRWHWLLMLGWSGYPAAHREFWFIHR